MKTIFISATMNNSGQSLFCWLLVEQLIKEGREVGVFRPMGIIGPEGVDPLMKLLFDLFGDQVAGSADCPLLVDPKDGIDPDLVEFHLDKIQEAFSELESQCDICIAIGSRDIFTDVEQSSLPDVKLIEMFDAAVFLLDRFINKSTTVYSALTLASFLRERLAGIIISRVPIDNWEEFYGETVPYLKEKGVPILAVIPEDSVISCPTLMDIKEILKGRIICRPEGMKNLVAKKAISANQLPPNMGIFKRVRNIIILLGGGPATLAKGRTEDVCGILLTGGKEPAASVVQSAQKNKIPLILTDMDTFGAMDRIDNSEILIKPRDIFRLNRLMTLLESDISIRELVNIVGK